MLGETYDRLLAGDAIMDPTNPLHLPDDGKWHGIGNVSHYKMDSYFDTNHTFNLCAPSFPIAWNTLQDERLLCRIDGSCDIPSSCLMRSLVAFKTTLKMDASYDANHFCICAPLFPLLYGSQELRLWHASTVVKYMTQVFACNPGTNFLRVLWHAMLPVEVYNGNAFCDDTHNVRQSMVFSASASYKHESPQAPHAGLHFCTSLAVPRSSESVFVC